LFKKKKPTFRSSAELEEKKRGEDRRGRSGEERKGKLS
jgi:hypothetical protein